jgi:TRAP-type mannitol/chloroaromatic compound transport system substrate-binding protein
MDRRRFLKGAAIGATAAAVASCSPASQSKDSEAGPAAPAVAKRKRNLKMVTTWPKNFPGLGTSAERVAQRIHDITDGEISVRVYAAGELVGALEAFDAVSTGAADMYNGAEYYWQGKSPAFNFFTAVPFGLTASEINAWIYHKGGQELWDKLSARFHIKAFMSANSGEQMMGWFNKEINSIDDLKGLKMRMPGLGGEVLRKLGAEAVTIPGGEIYQALASGRIDATEWVGPWNDLSLGFYRVAKYYYWPGFHEPGSSLSTGFNLDIWESFTKPQQAMIKAVCSAENDYTLAEFNANNASALRTLVDQDGVKLMQLSDKVLTAIGEASGKVVRAAGEADDLSKQIYESFMEARKDGSDWSRISDEAFWRARRLPFDY